MTGFALLVMDVVLIDQLIKMKALALSNADTCVHGNIFNLITLQRTTKGNLIFLIPRSIVLVVWAVTSCMLLVLMLTTGVLSFPSLQFALALLFGGSLSNVLDWHFRGFVLDFAISKIRLNGNFADLCIFLGLGCWLWSVYQLIL